MESEYVATIIIMNQAQTEKISPPQPRRSILKQSRTEFLLPTPSDDNWRLQPTVFPPLTTVNMRQHGKHYDYNC